MFQPTPVAIQTILSVLAASRTADEQPTAESQDKLRIQVDQSRVVFGVADSVDALQYGQCFFQPTMDNQPQVFSDTYLLVVSQLSFACAECLSLAEAPKLI